VSNRRKVPPREPDEAELAFERELKRAGCPACGSKTVLARFNGQLYDYGLRCPAECPSHGDERIAHRAASEAAARASTASGEDLTYTAVDGGMGQVRGVVRAR
jgi:hypothetical protein